MESHSVSLNLASPELLAHLNGTKDGKFPADMSQFLVPLLYEKLTRRAKGLKDNHTFRTFKEYKIGVKEIVAEYLNKNKKLPQSFVARKSMTGDKRDQLLDRFALAKLLSKKRFKKPKPIKNPKMEDVEAWKNENLQITKTKLSPFEKKKKKDREERLFKEEKEDS